MPANATRPGHAGRGLPISSVVSRLPSGEARLRMAKRLAGFSSCAMPESPLPSQSKGSPPDRAAMLKLTETVRRTHTQDGGVLLDIHHGQIFSLNLVGARILELLDSGFDEAGIADQVSRAYAMDLETVRADVHEFLEVLRRHHLLQVHSDDAIHEGYPRR